LEQALQYADKYEELAYDIETNGKSIYDPDNKMLCVGISGNKKTAWVIPEKYITIPVLRRITSNKVIIGTNIKFDISSTEQLYNMKITEKRLEDIYLWHFSLDQSRFGNGLKTMADAYFGVGDWDLEIYKAMDAITNDRIDQYEINKITNPNTPKPEKASFGDLVPEYADMLYKYNGLDCIYTYRLFKMFQKNKPAPPSYQFLMQANQAIMNMEKNGLPVNTKYIQYLKKKLNQNIIKNYKVFHSFPEVILAKSLCTTPKAKEGNVKATAFIRKLVKTTGMPTLKTTKEGAISVDKEVVKEYATEVNSPVWKYVQRIREDQDRISKFLKSYEEHIFNNRMHTSYILGKVDKIRGSFNDVFSGGASTGRLASRPNVQNLKKDPLARSIFQAEQGYCFVCLDYPQIELRVVAELSQSKAMIKQFKEGLDLHSNIIRILDELPADAKVDKKRRQIGKRANFAKLYGMNYKTFADMLEISKSEAKAVFEILDNLYPELNQYMQQIRQKIQQGYPLQTPYGRVRFFQLSGDFKMDAAVYREAGNFEVQATASDTTLLKAVEVFNWLQTLPAEERGECRPINVVHDDLWYEIKVDKLDKYVPTLQKIQGDMSTVPFDFDLPMPIDEIKVGYNLGMMKEVNSLKEAKEYLALNKKLKL
jgi:DNA polymerase I-like protein with 3'-5' exonuclease and polymerase domains